MRKLRISKSGKNNISISGANIDCGPGTLITSFEKVLDATADEGLSTESLEACKLHLDLITEKLQITPIQAVILSMVIDHKHTMDTEDMANRLGIRNIRMLTYMDEIENLLSRQIFHANDTICGSLGFNVNPEALLAFMQNKPFTPPTYRYTSLKKLIEAAEEKINECMNNKISNDALALVMNQLIDRNSRHEICKRAHTLETPEKTLYLFCCIKYVYEGERNICDFQYNGLFNSNVLRKLQLGLRNGCSRLLEQNLVVHSGRDGMKDMSQIGVSDDIKQLLDTALNLHWSQSEDAEARAGLLLFEYINTKPLYFNQSEQHCIDELTMMLQPERFAQIQQRLVEAGMRKGFACIFYGAPGTGKTETVFQIAKATGRDIMQVNVANIKSKWIGDSEKNIRNIFGRYRYYCKNSKATPILLFNEADAIISKRNENVKSTADKMENALQNIILEEMERLDGILIATTNLTSNIDKAFERRFLYKVEFHMPSESTRAHIWQSMIQGLSAEEYFSLAREFPFSGGQIENIARKQIVGHILHGHEVNVEDIRHDCLSERLNTTVRPAIGFR